MIVRHMEHATKKKGFANVLMIGRLRMDMVMRAPEEIVATGRQERHQLVLASQHVSVMAFAQGLLNIDANASKDGADQTVH
jgi:hypothetical protein